jgi:hypothetical protein
MNPNKNSIPGLSSMEKAPNQMKSEGRNDEK